jgi:hypothetical protein
MCKISNTTQFAARSDSEGKSSDNGGASELYTHIKDANRKVRLLDILRHYGFRIERNPQRPIWSNNITCPLPTHKGAKERTPSFGYNFMGDHCHCLAGGTGVYTQNGIVNIKDLKNKTIKVLGKDGYFVDGRFKSYGIQNLFKITMARDYHEKIIYATKGHRWFVYNSDYSKKEVITIDLEKNHHLVSMFYFEDNKVFNDWVVQSVEDINRKEEVYCAEVDDGHAFTLEGNILTGNCFGCGFTGRAVEFISAYEGVTRTAVAERILSQYGEDVSKNDFQDYEDDITPILFDGSKYIQKYIQRYKKDPEMMIYINKLVWWLDFYLAQKAPVKMIDAEEFQYRINKVKELLDEVSDI